MGKGKGDRQEERGVDEWQLLTGLVRCILSSWKFWKIARRRKLGGKKKAQAWRGPPQRHRYLVSNTVVSSEPKETEK